MTARSPAPAAVGRDLAPRVTAHRWNGEVAVTLEAGDLAATYLPALGMLGASFRHRGRELLARPGGLAGYRRGHVTGLPLLAPWANRLGTAHYRSSGIDVSLRGLTLHTDPNGLPIHGTMSARPGWEVVSTSADHTGAELHSRFDFGAHPELLESFPFPHELHLVIVVRGGELRCTTSVRASTERPVPVSFGYHPYFRLDGAPRGSWRLGLPSRQHLTLDDAGIPTGAGHHEAEDRAPIGTRAFDDLYGLGTDRELTLVGAGRRLSMRLDHGYPYAQVFAPPRRRFVCLEPMTAPTNALVSGECAVATAGSDYSATFTVGVEAVGPAL